VVPIAICGNERIPPRGSLLLRPGRIVVNKLPAITPSQYAGMTPFKLKNLVRDAIRQHLDNQSGV
jgi:1-acyl-sn-glycerol-3-phosphate acyltransferase